jgi:hypothetical protein
MDDKRLNDTGTMSKSSVFISYRRDDCTGYAGRLEEALERVFGHGTVFRDMRDIAAGENFADAIKSCLSTARVVLVLIGPRWMGPTPEGGRRIDGDDDFVRLEVAAALASGRKVVPVLLSGARLPKTEDLPELLRGLTQRQSLNLNESTWDADIERLIRSLGLPSVRRKRLLIAGGALVLLTAAGFAAYLNRPAPPVDASAATAASLVGTWQGEVRYGWGDQYEERFVFERFAGNLTGTASFLKYPRGMEDLAIQGSSVSFVTRTMQSMSGQGRELTHHYAAELGGDLLHFRMHTTGGFVSHTPLQFAARRLTATQKQPE